MTSWRSAVGGWRENRASVKDRASGSSRGCSSTDDFVSTANRQPPTANRLELRITGFGGQGVVLAAHIIGRACIEAGKHATMIQSFGPEARGASCSATLVISPDEVLYPYIQRPSILVAMSSDGYEKFKDELKPDGMLIYESDLVKPDGGWGLAVGGGEPIAASHESERPLVLPPTADRQPPTAYGIPSTRIAETLHKPMVQNIVMLGFVARVTNLVPVETMRNVVRDSVPAGTEEINLQAFDAGAAYVDEVLVEVAT